MAADPLAGALDAYCPIGEAFSGGWSQCMLIVLRDVVQVVGALLGLVRLVLLCMWVRFGRYTECFRVCCLLSLTTVIVCATFVQRHSVKCIVLSVYVPLCEACFRPSDRLCFFKYVQFTRTRVTMEVGNLRGGVRRGKMIENKNTAS